MVHTAYSPVVGRPERRSGMTRQPHVARRAEELLGTAVAATAPVAGGDIATATKLRLSSGRSAFMKTLTNAPPGFFEIEAAGLRWLGEAGGVTVPEVLAVETDCLILAWVEPGKLTTEAAGEFGRALARTHDAGAPSYGLDARRVHRPAAAAQQERAHVGGVLRHQAGPALPQARARPERDHARAGGGGRGRGRVGSPTWCRRRGRAACTATSGTAT